MDKLNPTRYVAKFQRAIAKGKAKTKIENLELWKVHPSN